MSKKKIKFKPKRSSNKAILIGIFSGAAFLILMGALIYVLKFRNKDASKTPEVTSDVLAGEVDFSDLEELDLSDYGVPIAMLSPPAAKQKDYYVLSKEHYTVVDMNPKFDGTVNFLHYPGQNVDITGEIQKAKSGGNWNNSFKLLGQNERGFYFETIPPVIEYVSRTGAVRREGGKPVWQIELFIPAGGNIWQISCHIQDSFSKQEADRRWAVLQKVRASSKPPESPHPLGNPPASWQEYMGPEFRVFVHVSGILSPAEKALKAEAGVPWASSADFWTFIWWIPRLNQRIEIYRLKPERLEEIQKDQVAFVEKASTDISRAILKDQKGTLNFKYGLTTDKKHFRDVVLKPVKGMVVCMRLILDGDRLFVLKVSGEEIKEGTHEHVKLFYGSFLLRPVAKR